MEAIIFRERNQCTNSINPLSTNVLCWFDMSHFAFSFPLPHSQAIGLDPTIYLQPFHWETLILDLLNVQSVDFSSKRLNKTGYSLRENRTTARERLYAGNSCGRVCVILCRETKLTSFDKTQFLGGSCVCLNALYCWVILSLNFNIYVCVCVCVHACVCVMQEIWIFSFLWNDILQ